MKVQFVESCVGDRFYFSKGDIVDTETTEVADAESLTAFLRDQVKAGHCVELETSTRAERATDKTAVEKR